MLRGSFTNAGLAQLVGLEGLFGLNVDSSQLAITGAALAPLVDLPHLGGSPSTRRTNRCRTSRRCRICGS